MHVAGCLAFESVIVVCFGCSVEENGGVGRVEFLIKDFEFADVSVCMHIEEEGVGGVLGYGGIHVTGWTRRA